MYSKYAVIQKIDINGKIKVFQIEKDYLNWTFEYRRKSVLSDNKDIFPIIIEDTCNIKERKPGAETGILKYQNGDIRFKDDYNVPGGFVICILGPIGYVPTMIKFKEKTPIPIGISNPYLQQNPGFLQLYSNKFIKQFAIVMLTTQNSFFSVEIIFSEKLGEYPTNKAIEYSDTFEASISLVDGEKTYITMEDIKNYCKGYERIHNIDEMLSSINEIIDILKCSLATIQRDSRLKTAKNKFETIFQKTLSMGSNIVTIADSISNQGFAYNMLKTLFRYFGQ